MPESGEVAATRVALLELRDERRLVQEGYDLLDEKRVLLATGTAETWLELHPADAAGVASIQDVMLSGDGELYAYSYFRVLSDLHLVTELR